MGAINVVNGGEMNVVVIIYVKMFKDGKIRENYTLQNMAICIKLKVSGLINGYFTNGNSMKIIPWSTHW